MTVADPGPPLPFPSAEDRLDAEVLGRLFARRALFLHGPLDGRRATRLAAELMTLEADGDRPVTLSVTSSGGELSDLFAVADTMAAMRAPVHTRCIGAARGTAAALVAAGTGRRTAAPHAQFELRLPQSDVSGSATDIERAASAQRALCEQLFALVARASGRPAERVARDWERGRFLSAQEALAEGLVDDLDR